MTNVLPFSSLQSLLTRVMIMIERKDGKCSPQNIKYPIEVETATTQSTVKVQNSKQNKKKQFHSSKKMVSSLETIENYFLAARFLLVLQRWKEVPRVVDLRGILTRKWC